MRRAFPCGIAVLLLGANAWAAPAHKLQSATCAEAMAGLIPRMPTETLRFDMNGLQVASLEDPTKSTGATLFYFPHGARAAFDARGGSVASVETSLLTPGSYSNQIDGLVFSGGSTMGLAATDGVRRAIYRERSALAGDFDNIPSVPGAVVYDFCGRVCSHNDPLVYPDDELGEALMGHLKSSFPIGRAGAGVTTTTSKIYEEGKTVFGGQGAAFAETPYGKVFTAVVLNPVGDIKENGQSIGLAIKNGTARAVAPAPKKNTTLSVVITDAPLDRNQLQRLSTMVHTSMAETISPFHTYTDGDINFAISTAPEPNAHTHLDEDAEFLLSLKAVELMKKSILESVKVANEVK